MKKQKNKKSDIRYTPETIKTDGSPPSLRHAFRRAKIGDMIQIPPGKHTLSKKAVYGPEQFRNDHPIDEAGRKACIAKFEGEECDHIGGSQPRLYSIVASLQELSLSKAK